MISKKIFFALFFITTFSFKCFSAAPYGVFMVIKGDVKVLKKEGLQIAKVGSQVQVGDTVTTGLDSRAKIVMSDRNIINISPDSKMQIQKYENENGIRKNAQINLEQGKLRLNVEETYDGEKNKFLIKTPSAVAGVRGTDFVINHDINTQQSDIFTIKGQVAFVSTQNGQIFGKPVLVHKGESSSAQLGVQVPTPQKMPPPKIKEIDTNSQVSLGDRAKKDLSQNATGSDKKQERNREQKLGDKIADKKNQPSGMQPPGNIGSPMAGGPEFDPNMMPPPPPPPPGMLPPPNPMGPPPPNPAVGQIVRDLILRTNVKILPRP